MGSTLCVTDAYIWRRPVVKSRGAYYYEYVMTYVYVIIAVSMDAVGILEDIARFSGINNDKIQLPPGYLGDMFVNKTADGVIFVDHLKSKLFQGCAKNVIKGLRSKTYCIPSKVVTPMEQRY